MISRLPGRIPWPLLAILGVQAALSLRLIWANTAFIDEATYLYAGHQMIAHWLHGTPVMPYQAFFSGSPAIYPPLGALADGLGGLAGARLLGLMFMLGATTLLYKASSRLFGERTAFLATTAFVALGVTQFLSAFATYDPMAIFLLALCAYLTLRFGGETTLGATLVALVGAPLALALANGTKYATTLWDPVLIGLAICIPAMKGTSWRSGILVGARFSAILATVLTLGLLVGNTSYLTGIEYTTVERSSLLTGMNQPASLVVDESWLWIGPVLGCATLGFLVVLVRRNGTPTRVLCGLLLVALLAAPLNQARIGTTVSLHKHVVFGAWFGCILAGYALRAVLRWRVPVVIGAASLMMVGVSAYSAQATSLYEGWRPVNPAFITGLKPLVRSDTDRYLVEDDVDIISYYTGSVTSIQWKNSARYSYNDPATGRTLLNGPAFAAAIHNRVFSIIALDFAGGFTGQQQNDQEIVTDITRSGDYKLIGTLPPSHLGSHAAYTVWQLIPTGSAS